MGPQWGTLKMRDMKMQDWKMRHKPAGHCRGWKMRDWKNVALKYGAGKCRNGKSGKRKICKAVCKVIIWTGIMHIECMN